MRILTPERGRAVLYRICGLLCLMISIASLALQAQDVSPLSEYVGKWVIKATGRNFVVLSLKLDHDKIAGSVAMPKGVQWDQGGDLTVSDATVQTTGLSNGIILNGHLDIQQTDNKNDPHFLMTLIDHNTASFDLAGIPLPFGKLQRVNGSEQVSVATDWPAQEPKVVSPEIAALQAELKQMAAEDQSLRTGTVLSDAKMTQLSDRALPELERIYEKYGWPKISLVGKEASGEYWLLVQHQNPEFQRKLLSALQRAVEEGEASKVNYAYLYDRVMVGEGKPQHWGTQVKCKDGQPVISPVDDPAGLQQRREELQLTPLDKYLETLAPSCAKVRQP